MALDYFPYAEPSQGDTDHDLFLKIATALYLVQQQSPTQGAAVASLGGVGDLAAVRDKVDELLVSLRNAQVIAT
jgi:hypothetical protein